MLLRPLMLTWVGGAVLPLLVHLLSRSRYRVVPWGAMMFLTGAPSHPLRGARARQNVLLSLRMCAVGLLAVALARPVVASHYSLVPTAGLTTAGPAAVVLIVDDSASMGYFRDGKSRLDHAREVTLQLLGALKRTDQTALLLAGASDAQPTASLSPDLQSIASRIEDLEPDIGQADFAFEINKAVDLLAHSRFDDQEIYLICDAQALSWKNVAVSFSQRLKARHSKRPLPRITVIPVGGDESDNVAVEAIEVPDHFAIKDQPEMVTVRVHNYGSTSQPAVPLAVWTGARTIAQTTVAVPPRSITSVNVPLRYGEVGSRVLSAAVTSTGLTTDKRLDSAFDVVDPFQVLMVNDAPQIPASRLTTTTLPATPASARNREPFSVKTVPFSDWPKETLNKMDVIIFFDVPHFDADEQSRLQQFVSAGGGVLLLLGDHVDADNYNKSLFKDGHGLIPAAIHPLKSTASRITNANIQNPMFRYLPNHLDLTASGIFTVGSIAAASNVLGRLPAGDPWLIENNIGRGRVIMMTVVIQPDMENGLFRSMVRYLGGGIVIARNLRPGEPIVALISDPVDERSATVQLASGGPRERAVVTSVAGHTQIAYANTNRPGTYRLRYRTAGKEKSFSYVVSSQKSDSDLTPLTQDQWQILADRVGFRRIDLSKSTVADAVNISRGGREIWIDLLIGVLILMTLEMLFSRL